VSLCLTDPRYICTAFYTRGQSDRETRTETDMSSAAKKRRGSTGQGPLLPEDRSEGPVVVHTEFDLRSSLPTNNQMDHVYPHYTRPVENGYADLQAFTFEFPGDSDKWLDLSGMWMEIVCKITGPAGAAIADALNPRVRLDQLAPYALFRQVQVKLNGNPLPHSGYTPLRELFRITPSLSLTKARNMKDVALYPWNTVPNIYDEHTKGPDTRIPADAGDRRVFQKDYPALNQQIKAAGSNINITFGIHIPTEICEQRKMLPPNTKFTLEVHRASNKYPLIINQNMDGSALHIIECTLHANFYKLTPDNNARYLRQIFQDGVGKYPVMRKEIKTAHLATASNQRVNNITSGEVPRLMIVGFKQATHITGTNTSVLAQFSQINLTNIKAIVGGVAYPNSEGYKVDFTEGNLGHRVESRPNLFAYREFARCAIPQDIEDPFLDYLRWEGSMTLYAFDFTKDANQANAIHYKNIPLVGNVEIQLECADNVPANTVMVVYSVYDKEIELHSSSNIVVDYT